MNLLFGRKEFAFNLERIIKNIDEGNEEENKNVIAIHSEFGTGKSHFVNEFSKHFKTEHKFIICNAWKNDYVGNPLGSIAGLIRDTVKNENGAVENIANSILEISWKLGKKLTPLVITALIRKYIGFDLKEIDIKDEDVDKLINSFISEEIKNYDDKKNLIEQLEKELKDLKNSWLRDTNKKIIFIIDELDRCRPDFALELLERIKHLFDVKGFVFLIFLNDKHLNSMIDVNYGKDVTSEGYLRKFFDYEFRLPEADIAEYIENVIGLEIDLKLFKENDALNKKLNFCYYIFLELMKEKYKNNSILSIRDFQYYNKKFKLILKTFNEEDLKFVNVLSFPFYFWYVECPESFKNEKERRTWINFIEIINLKINHIKFNRGNYIDQNFQNMNELYFDFSKKNKISYQFINGLLNGVNADVEDTGNIDDVEKWCKEKINFLKFVEIDK